MMEGWTAGGTDRWTAGGTAGGVTRVVAGRTTGGAPERQQEGQTLQAPVLDLCLVVAGGIQLEEVSSHPETAGSLPQSVT